MNHIYYIDDLDLLIKEDNKYVPLTRELHIGETAYFRNNSNKVKRISEDTYEFHRFDHVGTNVYEDFAGYPFSKIKEKIIDKLDQSLKYANERKELVDRLLEENYWIYNLLSSDTVIKRVHKKKTDPLAEKQKLDNLFDQISIYLRHPMFKDKEDEKYYLQLVERRNYLKKFEQSEEIVEELLHVEEIIDKYKNRLHSDDSDNLTPSQDKQKQIKLEKGETFDFQKDARSVIRKRYIRKRQFDVTFWKRMGYSDEQADWRNNLINTYEQEIMSLEKQLGYDKPLEERQKIQEKILYSLHPKKFTVDGKKVYYSPKRQLKVLNDMYSSLKGDFKSTIEKLTDQIRFKRLDKESTEYVWHEDTWRKGEIEDIHISKNLLTYANPDTYKGFLLTYYELKDKYKDSMHEDMWAFLVDFENLLADTNLDYIEKEICYLLMNDYDAKEVSKLMESKYNVDSRKIYRFIDTYIPNKLASTYINKVDEWLYTEKLKGKWKKCSKCEEVKLISNDRYFGKDPRNKDGFKSICKKCDNYTKK